MHAALIGQGPHRHQIGLHSLQSLAYRLAVQEVQPSSGLQNIAERETEKCYKQAQVTLLHQLWKSAKLKLLWRNQTQKESVLHEQLGVARPEQQRSTYVSGSLRTTS